MTAHSPFGSIPIRCKAKVCSPSLSPALQAHKAHSMQVAPALQRGMTSVKQRIEQDMRLMPNGCAHIHARYADGAHNPKRKEPIGSFLASQSFSPRTRDVFRLVHHAHGFLHFTKRFLGDFVCTTIALMQHVFHVIEIGLELVTALANGLEESYSRLSPCISFSWPEPPIPISSAISAASRASANSRP